MAISHFDWQYLFLFFFQFVLILYFGKSAVNPFIYGWKNRDFRFAFGRLLNWLPCQRVMEHFLDSDIRRESAISLSRRSTARKTVEAELPSMERTANNGNGPVATSAALVARFEATEL